jgi:LysR family transcriptional regulator, glycine cleavage system transcriptional activator
MFRFFEAAARHLNFTRAAEEMHVTHGAVSQRIKRLEAHLGTPLFQRSAGRMQLTDAGTRLLERVKAAISEIAEGVESIRAGNAEQILTISTVPCFAAYWLVPRLADFNQQHPDHPDQHSRCDIADEFYSRWRRHGSALRPGHVDGAQVDQAP